MPSAQIPPMTRVSLIASEFNMRRMLVVIGVVLPPLMAAWLIAMDSPDSLPVKEIYFYPGTLLIAMLIVFPALLLNNSNILCELVVTSLPVGGKVGHDEKVLSFSKSINDDAFFEIFRSELEQFTKKSALSDLI